MLWCAHGHTPGVRSPPGQWRIRTDGVDQLVDGLSVRKLVDSLGVHQLVDEGPALR